MIELPSNRGPMNSTSVRLLLAGLLALWFASIQLGAQTPPPQLVTVFGNPAPRESTYGASTAAMGDRRVLVGGGGATTEVYLFDVSGQILATFKYPDPEKHAGFGYPLVALGTDRVLIGAQNGGIPTEFPNEAAYIFKTNGTLLITITNPVPTMMDGFAASAAALPDNRILISSIDAADRIGLVYLYGADGALLNTITNPTPATNDNFGAPVAAFGTDRVLIGKTSLTGPGQVYLFGIEGKLLSTFTSPTPSAFDWFGASVAGRSTDQILVGAPLQVSGGITAGAAYLFTTNGTLITTFRNPSPRNADYFGISTAALGNNRVMIGAYGKSVGAIRPGAAYIFSTNGTLLATIPNPFPVNLGQFGVSITALDSDRVVIGAFGNTSGGVLGAGAAYLFTLQYPKLSITPNGTSLDLGWKSAETGFVLQETAGWEANPAWINSTSPPSVSGSTNVVRVPLGSSNGFFRLHRP